MIIKMIAVEMFQLFSLIQIESGRGKNKQRAEFSAIFLKILLSAFFFRNCFQSEPNSSLSIAATTNNDSCFRFESDDDLFQLYHKHISKSANTSYCDAKCKASTIKQIKTYRPEI